MSPQTFQPRGTYRPMTNAERQQAWRDRHRPAKPKFVAKGPDGQPIRMVGPIPPFQTRGMHRPMTNAERQAAWRDRHRPTKRKMLTTGPNARQFVPTPPPPL